MAALVGRTAEIAEVRTAVATAVDGHGRLLLIGGVGGIGKTALAEAAQHEAASRGVAVGRGQAVDDPGAPPLWPWLRLMRGWPESVTPAADLGERDAQARFRLFAHLTEVIQQRARPDGLLLVLEDLHWADELSVLLLRHLATELSAHPIVVVATYRPVTDEPLAAVLPDLVRAATSLHLDGLTGADVAEWLPHLLGRLDPALAEVLQRRTDGNPLLIRLVAEDLARRRTEAGLDRLLADRPELRRLILAKADTLDAPARHLVDVAAVLGERVPFDLLAAVADEPGVRTVIRPAVEAGVFVVSADAVRFEHALVRDAVYEQLGPGETADLHRRSALTLAAVGAPPALIAMHWQRSAGSDAVTECGMWAERADDAARAAVAHADAVRFAELAVDCGRRARVGDGELARLLLRAAGAYALAERVEPALARAAEAADRAEACGRADLLAEAGLVVHGSGHQEVFRIVPPICERALARLGPDDTALRARLLAQIAVGVAETEGGPRAAELAAAALAVAEESGDVSALVDAIAARHLAITVPQSVTERLALGTRMVDLARVTGRPMAGLWGHLWRADAAFQLGNLAEMDRETAAIERIATSRGSVLARWHGARHAAARAVQAGDFDAARAANQVVFDIGVQVGDYTLSTLSFAFRNQLSILLRDGTEMPANWLDIIGGAPLMPLIRIGIPTQHALVGELDLARAEFEQFRPLARTFPVGVRWYGTVANVGHVAVLLDDAETAGDAYDAMSDLGGYYSGDGSGVVFAFGATARLLGDLARVARRYDVALERYREALAMNRRVHGRPFVALTRLGWAETLVAAGRRHDPMTGESPAALLDPAIAEFDRLGMASALATATALRDSVGRDPDSPLTAREAEVARLVAESLSNKQIASRLFVSERTVETHVRSILAKLGFTKRTEIVSWMVQR